MKVAMTATILLTASIANAVGAQQIRRRGEDAHPNESVMCAVRLSRRRLGVISRSVPFS